MNITPCFWDTVESSQIDCISLHSTSGRVVLAGQVVNITLSGHTHSSFFACLIPPTFNRYHRLIWMNDGADAQLVYPLISPIYRSFCPTKTIRDEWM